MIYHFTISTPANTSKSNPQLTRLKLSRGVIHQIDIFIPAGHEGLAHLVINRGLHQVWPSNYGEDFNGDDSDISFREHYRLTKAPYLLECYTWNEDTSYAHSFILRVGILPEEVIVRRLF